MDSLPTKIPYNCTICNAGSSSYLSWLVHLTTVEHQQQVKQLPGQGESELKHPNRRNKVLLVTGIAADTPLIEVGKYFSKWGILKSFIYVGQEEAHFYEDVMDDVPKMMCLIEYASEDHVRDAVNFKFHELGGLPINVQRRFGDSSQNREGQSIQLEKKQPINESRLESFVQVDLSEFKVTEKQKSVVENQNEYQKIALQIKDDLADLKLDEQVDSFCQLLCLTQDQIQKRFNLGTQLLKILQRKFKDCAIYPFGHDYLGIATDIDTMNVALDLFGKMTDEFGPIHAILPACQSDLIKDVFDLLKQEQYKLQFCRDVEIKWYPWTYSDCKIQKITFIHRDSGVVCNLVLENFIVVQENRLAKFLITLDPRIHPLLCIVRFFSSVYNCLHSSDEAFRGHSMIWLLLFYLSSKNIIPTCNNLQSLSVVPLVVENSDISFCNDLEIIKPEKTHMIDNPAIRAYSCLSLVKDFFQFCGEVNLKQNVVCPAVGRLVPVAAFGKTLGKNFPFELRKRYLFNEDGTSKDRRFYCGSPMGLQNPLDLTTNLTKNVTISDVTQFQDLCLRASNKLSNLLESGCGEIMDLFTNLPSISLISSEEKMFTSMDIDCKLEPTEESSESDDESEKEVSMEIPEPEPKEESSWELDTEREDDDYEFSYQEVRHCRIRLSQSLRKFFERAIASDPSILEMGKENLSPTDLTLPSKDSNEQVSDISTDDVVLQNKITLISEPVVPTENIDDTSSILPISISEENVLPVSQSSLTDADENMDSIMESMISSVEKEISSSASDPPDFEMEERVVNGVDPVAVEIVKAQSQFSSINQKNEHVSVLPVEENIETIETSEAEIPPTPFIGGEVRTEDSQCISINEDQTQIHCISNGISIGTDSYFLIDEESISNTTSSSFQPADADGYDSMSFELRRKFQAIWFQYLLEFNSRFWSECFGFIVETDEHQKVSPADYSKTDQSTSLLTLKEKLDLVQTDDEICGVEFRCETGEKISDLLYKKKVWSHKKMLAQIRPLWLTLTGKATSKATSSETDLLIENTKKQVYVPFERRMEFSCNLQINFDLREGKDIPKNGNLGTSARLRIKDESYGSGKLMRTRKLRFLSSLYERLSMKYINLRMKQWLASCKEFQYAKIDAEYKKDKKKEKGHPRWRKFRRRAQLIKAQLQTRNEI